MMPRRNAASESGSESENENENADYYWLTVDDSTRLMMMPGEIDPGSESESESDEEYDWPRRRGNHSEKWHRQIKLLKENVRLKFEKETINQYKKRKRLE